MFKTAIRNWGFWHNAPKRYILKIIRNHFGVSPEVVYFRITGAIKSYRTFWGHGQKNPDQNFWERVSRHIAAI